MKNFILLGAFASSIAMADTVILYDDGSTYTVGSKEKIYIQTLPLYKARGGYKAGKFIFERVDENTDRDYETAPVPTEESCDPNSLTFGEICTQPEETEVCDPNSLTFGEICTQPEETEVCGPNSLTFGEICQ